MFVHALLFSLLGTSVVSLPITPNDSPAIQVPHSPHHVQPFPPYSPLSSPEDTATFSTPEKGKEFDEPILVPDSLGHLIHPLPHQTLSLGNIELYADRWYREPTNDVEYNLRNDIIEILVPPDGNGKGIIVFHTMGELPGEVIWQNTFLTSENRHRLVGTWRRMPSDLPELRNDVMVVWETLGRLHYAVRYNHPDMRRKNISLRVSYDIPSSDCVGTWIRVPEKHTVKEYLNDIAVIWPSGHVDIHIITMSGLASSKLLGLAWDRLVGIWYRAPSSKIEVDHRLDQMVVEIILGRLAFRVDRQEAPMMEEPDNV